MAKLARKIGDGLDAVMAMTGHKDIKLADHYSKLTEEDQKEVSIKIAKKIKMNELENNHLDNVIILNSNIKGTSAIYDY